MSEKKEEVELKVGELTQREEFGRGLARIDSATMQKIGVREGDIIEIEGTRKTSAVAVRAYPADAGLNVARMDGLVRRNSGAGVGDNVKIRKAEVKEAKKVTLAPAQEGVVVQISPNLIKQNIYYRPLTKGDIIVPSPIVKGREDMTPSIFQEFLGFDFEEFFFTPTGETRFVVTNTEPAGVVKITDMTELEILSRLPKGFELEQRAVPSVTYEDIGGMHDAIQKVREMIELPLRHPELFTRLGIEPPKGVLLHGPPGCGKTLLAKAVANESGVNFYSIAGPEIMSMWYGKSEENLRKVFEEAEKNAPGIIFIDEIDSIAPKREEVHGEVERRVVSQLLTLMDGLKSRGKVIVVAATNVPNIIDPALRRPGRFDREIEIGIPDAKGRKEILEIHTRNMPLKDINLKEIGDTTYGYTGADITALTKEAAMYALRRLLPKIKWKEEEKLSKEDLEKLVVTKGDFDYARRIVEPSAMREVMIEIPNVHWSEIGGLEDVKEQLKESVEWPLTRPESFSRMGITPPKGVLLYGPPGCGKTLLAKAVANEAGANFISVKGPELFSKWVGESEKKVRELFRRAKQVAPTIIFFDEIDAMVPRRGQSYGEQVTEKIVSQMLTELSGLEDLHDVVVLAATNRPDMLDPALLRPGRFDRQILIPAPDEGARLKIFEVHTKNIPIFITINEGVLKEINKLKTPETKTQIEAVIKKLQKTKNQAEIQSIIKEIKKTDEKLSEKVKLTLIGSLLEKMAKQTEGFSGADLEALCREAAMQALRENKTAKEVTMKHFEKALKELKPSLGKDVLDFYNQFDQRSNKNMLKEAKEEEKDLSYVG
jgi:transitional endoplasmic reticulum ATPase